MVQAGLGFDVDTSTAKATAEATAKVNAEVNAEVSIKLTTSGLGYRSPI